MYSTKIVKELNADTILSIVNEYDIFKHYLGDSLEIGRSMHSPFRKDENPSFCVFRTVYGSYKFRYIDFVTRETGSCFQMVMRLYNCDYNTCHRLIDRDMNLQIFRAVLGQERVPQVSLKLAEPIAQRSVIQVGIRKWNATTDKQFWTQYGISGRTLVKYQVYPLSHFRLNGVQYAHRDLTYAYYFGNESWKIYRPYADRKTKWLSNVSSDVIQGWQQLPLTGEVLIITKALKDVMLLHELGIPSIAPQSEGTLINAEKIADLKKRFNKIYLNFDFDYAGVRSGNKYRKNYGIQTLYFTNGRFGTIDYGAKDLSDYVKINGKQKLEELIKGL